MKYTLIEAKGQYALVLRGESMTQYAVVSGLDKETGSWDWTCCYYDFGESFGLTMAEALFKALDYYLARTNDRHISWTRMGEIVTLLKDGLIEDGEEDAYIDRTSGKSTNRPELQKMMEYVRHGDTVIVESISRFARNTRDLLDLIERLTSKGVEFVSKKEAIDTTTPTGKFMLTIFGAVAELEREYILQRQHEGIAIAKEQGKYAGRKANVPPNFDTVVARWRNGKITAVEAMQTLRLSKSTFYRLVKSTR